MSIAAAPCAPIAAGDVRGQAGQKLVGRDGGDDDVVHLGGVASGVGQRLGAGHGRQLGQRDGAVEVAALADARALDDPGVGRVEWASRSALVITASGRAPPIPITPAFHAATRRVRLTRPRRTAPGPHST